jgi:uncharacterized membrane protein
MRKGLCPDCAAQRTNGLACRGACENRVDLLNRVIDNNALTLAAARYRARSYGIVVTISGIVFLGSAYVVSTSPGWGLVAFLLGCLGATCLALGVTSLNKKSQYPAPDK